MATVYFRNCECGIKLRIVQERDGQRQLYVCSCGRSIGFDGSVILLHFASAERPASDYEWTKVPNSSIEDLK